MNDSKTKEPRDISMATFRERLEHYGMVAAKGVIGDFVCVARDEHGRSRHVYRYNAGMNRRRQLAYLLREREAALRHFAHCLAPLESGVHKAGGDLSCLKCRALTQAASKQARAN